MDDLDDLYTLKTQGGELQVAKRVLMISSVFRDMFNIPQTKEDPSPQPQQPPVPSVPHTPTNPAITDQAEKEASVEAKSAGGEGDGEVTMVVEPRKESAGEGEHSVGNEAVAGLAADGSQAGSSMATEQIQSQENQAGDAVSTAEADGAVSGGDVASAVAGGAAGGDAEAAAASTASGSISQYTVGDKGKQKQGFDANKAVAKAGCSFDQQGEIPLDDPFYAAIIFFDLLSHNFGDALFKQSSDSFVHAVTVMADKYDVPYMRDLLLGVFFRRATLWPRAILRISAALGDLALARYCIHCIGNSNKGALVAHPGKWDQDTIQAIGCNNYTGLIMAAKSAGLNRMDLDISTADWGKISRRFTFQQ